MADSPETRPSLLLRLGSTRDERAWEEFVALYGPLVRRLARRSGLQGADADDLAQEVFRAVAGAIGRWDSDPSRGSFRAWLARIARNLIVNLMAARRRHPAGIGAGGTDMVTMLLEQPDSAEDSAIFDLEYRRRLFALAADRIREEFREPTWQAFWRTGVDGQDVRSVAEALGLSPGSVYVARSRVMARLRREIEAIEGTE